MTAQRALLSPPMLRLIDTLADELVADYLREQAMASKGQGDPRSYPVQLPATDKAA